MAGRVVGEEEAVMAGGRRLREGHGSESFPEGCGEEEEEAVMAGRVVGEEEAVMAGRVVGRRRRL